MQTDLIPCACGCGTLIPARTNGVARRFVFGHQRIKPLTERFWAKVDRSGGPDSCWPWTAKISRGYGQVYRDGQLVYAHRVAWELANGAVPDSLLVLHRCDHRPCCNAAHLFLGTARDNAADRASKGRSADQHGTRHHGHRLNEANIRAIRRAAAHGTDQYYLAARFGVSQAHISNVVNGKRWAHLDPKGAT